MKNLLIFLLVALLAACDRGTPMFWDVPPTRVLVADIAFDVRVLGQVAQAERVTFLAFPNRASILGPARNAVAQVTGCSMHSVDANYDPSIITMRLLC